MKKYDVVIIGAGASGVYMAYEFALKNKGIKVCMLDKGNPVEKRICPINGTTVKSCVHCKTCSIMNGFGGAGGMSDGKYNITNSFGGNLYQYIGEKEALDLMNYVDDINCENGGDESRIFSTSASDLKREALKYDLHLLDAEVRHFGTDINRIILKNIYNIIKDKIDIHFNSEATSIKKENDKFFIDVLENSSNDTYCCNQLVIAAGRSGSQWIADICNNFNIKTTSNKVDIGVRVEVPCETFEKITKDVYESKIVYRTKKYGDLVRTFCMNPYGEVVTENTNGIITVNGHSYGNPDLYTENTNFALLVSNNMSKPFKDSNAYGQAIATLSNMLGGGVLVQRFGDLINGKRSNEHRLEKSFLKPTLNATPGDLSLVLPKRQLDDIIEMIYALDKIAPGTANDDTLLYGVEVKFYNSLVEVNNELETNVKGLYILGDGSGVTHSLSQAAASGVYVSRIISDLY